MVENRKNITKLKIKHRNGAIARPSVHTFLLQRVEKTFSTGVLPKYQVFQEHYGHIPLICLVFSAM